MNTADFETKDSSQKLMERVEILSSELEEAKRIIVQKNLELKAKDETISGLYEKLKLFLQKQFGKKSEKSDVKEPEKEIPPIPFDDPRVPNKDEIEAADEEITVAAYTRKKRGRKALPANIPREEVVHDLKDEEKVCGCCGGKLSHFGDDLSEQLQYIPAELKILVNVRRKYACRSCEGTVKSATLPKQPIPKSIATAGLLTHIIISKYAYHLPLYRQEAIFRQLGVDLPRNTTCLWMIKVAKLCSPIYENMCQAIRNGSYSNADETPLRVLKEKGLSKRNKSFMFVYLGGDRENPTIVFKCHSTRAGINAEEFFQGFKGYLQTDAFSGYEIFKDNPFIVQVGCWAHARRKFIEIVKITNNPGLAHEAVDRIKKLYEIEKIARESNLSNEKRKYLREKEAKPILLEFKAWLDTNSPQAPPKSVIGKAMAYALNNWEKLNRYVEDGMLEIDNNLNENAIRPLALGRKNWLFSGNEHGAAASAVIYSLIETCKTNGIDPTDYFNNILTKLPYCKNNEEYAALSPQKYKALLYQSNA
jgi:transposase